MAERALNAMACNDLCDDGGSPPDLGPPKVGYRVFVNGVQLQGGGCLAPMPPQTLTPQVLIPFWSRVTIFTPAVPIAPVHWGTILLL